MSIELQTPVVTDPAITNTAAPSSAAFRTGCGALHTALRLSQLSVEDCGSSGDSLQAL